MLKVNWREVFCVKTSEDFAFSTDDYAFPPAKMLTRDELCDALLLKGYCVDRASGMRLIALGTRDKHLEFVAVGNKNVSAGSSTSSSSNNNGSERRDKEVVMSDESNGNIVSSSTSSSSNNNGSGSGWIRLVSNSKSKMKLTTKAAVDSIDQKDKLQASSSRQITAMSRSGEDDRPSSKPFDAVTTSSRRRQEVEVESKLLSPEQRKVVDLVGNGENVFFSGSAGVGKSFLLKHLVKRESLRRVSSPGTVISTSLTGLASCNIDGVTIHSFAGIGLGLGSAEELATWVCQNRLALRRWRQVELLFIDEVSMLDASLFEKLEYIVRVTRNSTRVFGGIQLCLSGDFFQLPPVGLGQGGVRFCFESPLWNQVVTRSVLLTQCFRQTEHRLISFLSDLRRGQVQQDVMHELCSRGLSRYDDHDGDENIDKRVLPTTLFAKNADVDRINQRQLTSLKSPIVTFDSYDWYRDPSSAADDNRLERLLGSAPASVSLAVGAQVILTKNLSADLGLVNGSRGVVVGFEPVDVSHMEEQASRVSSELYARMDPNEVLPVVLFASKQTPRVVNRVEFEVMDSQGQEKIASRCAIPLRLAWALSMHKSQGQTIDLLDVDLSGVFEYGQAFVALSRASRMDGLRVRGFHDLMPLANPKVIDFYRSLEERIALENTESLSNSIQVRRNNKEDEDNDDDDVAWLPIRKRPRGSD